MSSPHYLVYRLHVDLRRQASALCRPLGHERLRAVSWAGSAGPTSSLAPSARRAA
ncbi:MAG TPA: putative leader peptide [Streptosporangiaceae bacterium]|nr:putative leader peptide [Streptosporangiaceae bacterium]